MIKVIHLYKIIKSVFENPFSNKNFHFLKHRNEKQQSVEQEFEEGLELQILIVLFN